MAKKKNVGFKKGQKEDIIINKVNVRPPYRVRLDVQKWLSAIKSAEGLSHDKRRLFDIYHDVLTTGGHLNSITEKRIKPVKNAKVSFNINNKPVDEINDLVGKPYFKDLMRYMAEALFWGHSLIELKWYGDKFETYLIPRKHVRPELGIVTYEEFGYEGIDYTTNPYIIEVGSGDNLGLFSIASYFSILKRGNYGDWADYGEVFGQPFAHGTYEDDPTADLLTQAFEGAGFRRYVVSPKDAAVSYTEASSNTGADTFEKFKNAMNTELSTLILGQSMTTSEASFGGYAQGRIHKDVEASIIVDDIDEAVAELNEQLIPILELLGYNTKGGKFSVIDEDNMPLKDRIVIDTQVANIVPVSDDYFYETYGIPKPDKSEIDKKKEEEEGTKKKEDEKKKEKEDKTQKKDKEENLSYNTFSTYLKQFKDFFFSNPVNLISDYKPDTVCLTCEADINLAFGAKVNEDIINDYLKSIHNGSLKPDSIPNDLYFEYAKKFVKALSEGYANMNPAYDSPDNNMLAHLRSSLFVFSCAKSLAQNKEIANELLDSDGNVKSFNDFKADVSKITKLFNGNWLLSEYNNTITNGQMASKWVDIQENKEALPYLEYRTVGDNRVRPSHAKLDRIKLPVDDDAWNTIYPPNGWGDRCNVVQTDNGRNLSDPATIGKDMKLAVSNKNFKRNVGKEKEIFDDNHAYYKNSPNVMNLQAEKNYGMRSFAKMNNSLKDFPKGEKPLASIEEYNVWFDAQIAKHKSPSNDKAFVLANPYKDKIEFDAKFKKHILAKKQNEHANLINKTITDPDEVWFKEIKGKMQYSYIKYYESGIYGLITNEGMKATTFKEIQKETDFVNYRKGVLMYKNTNRL